MIKRKCKKCGQEFKSYPSQIEKGQALYCSNKCRYSAIRRYRSKEVKCLYCGKKFYRAFSQLFKKTFCNDICKNAYRKSKKIYIECKICHKKFYIKANRLRIKYKAQYCSRKCYGVAKRLKHHLSNGYYKVYALYHPFADCDGNVYEHRLIMEKKLGRFLKPTEEIHHINENRADNRIGNLQLLSKSEHIKLHKKDKNWRWKKCHK